MSVQVSYKKQVLFGFLLILIVLSAIETSMRIYDYYSPNCKFIESDVYDEVNFDLKRNICNDNGKLIWNNDPLYLIPNQHFQTININSHGFRGAELQNDPTYRIFIIGGSTTFGVGASSDFTTIPYFIQEKFMQEYPNYNIEVINAGIPNAYSFTEKNLITEKLLTYEPNLLVIYDGWNDLGRDYEQYENSVDYKLMDQIIRKIRQSDFTTPNVILKIYFNYKNNSVDIIPFNSNKIEEKVSLWKNTWIDICNLQEKYDFKTIITLQPLVGTGKKILSVEEQKGFSYADGRSQISNYNEYANTLGELDSICTATFDLRGVFDSQSKTIFFDYGHVGDYGNKIVGNNIYERILPTVLEDLSK